VLEEDGPGVTGESTSLKILGIRSMVRTPFGPWPQNFG